MSKQHSTRTVRGQRVRPCIQGLLLHSKSWLEVNGQFAIGDGGVELLNAIDTTGSLRQGSKQIGWSYRHAWGYIRRAEDSLGFKLIATRAGKGNMRGTSLTESGKLLAKGLSEFAATL